LTDEFWMRHAITCAQYALPLDVPIGAVLIDAGGNIMAEGWNTRERDHDPSGHAELNVIREGAHKLSNWRLTNCTLYVTLEPCPMCAALIYQSRISRVVYGSTDLLQGALGSALQLGNLYGHTLSIQAGVLEAECAALLAQFFKEIRKT
jgi:tRNA(adenine34) deaminase